MHIGIIAPVNISSFAPALNRNFSLEAEAVAPATGTAPTSLALALVEEGHHVSVVTHSRGEAPLDLSGDGLRVIRVGSRARAREQVFDSWRQERRAMGDVMAQLRPEVVHAHWAYEWSNAGISIGSPLAITVRDAPLTVLRYDPSLYRLIRFSMAMRTRVQGQHAAFAAPSPYLADLWQKQTFSRRSFVDIVPNLHPPDMNVSNSAKAGNPLSVEIADSGARKNLPNLLRAFAIVRQSMPSAELRLIGAGLAECDALHLWAKREKLSEGVTFLGQATRVEVAEQLSSAWLHVHAALEETFGNTLVEAMKLGTAVLAGAESGSVPWVLGDGHAGRLTDVRDPAKFAADWTALLRNEDSRSSLASDGHRRAMTAFGPTSVVPATLALYDRAKQLHAARARHSS